MIGNRRELVQKLSSKIIRSFDPKQQVYDFMTLRKFIENEGIKLKLYVANQHNKEGSVWTSVRERFFLSISFRYKNSFDLQEYCFLIDFIMDMQFYYAQDRRK